ncbi:hypothetical protein RSOLAG22IIIB_10183 [Rhizoctonia solani]|uniref:F-box domain-containing protein n=1 Tax=Rhizoctonia solani TaxID=456999 RepID=A0A0K6G274_9AGAM|nr:hypothetical protein RSOLAG22IIIB_10183 [Rhizoctonia solani]
MSSVYDSDDQREDENSHYELARGRPSKRGRTDTSRKKAPRKKHIKGKQGGLEGVMKVPIEVFTEIAHYLNPADLLSLVQTNKFFRSMLLNRSAVLIWQRSLGNVPGLPPCPTRMIEPQYAALLYSKHCTAGPIFTRATILETVQLDDLENFIPFTTILKGKKLGSKTPIYCLRAQKAKFDRVKEEFVNNNDGKGLDEWKLQQLSYWKTQRQEGDQLLKYFDSVAASRSDELQVLKLERKERIHERLRALGWENRYLDCPGNSEHFKKKWSSLVEVAKPLTERIWTNLLPKLTRLLEENRGQVEIYEQEQRQYERQRKVEELLGEFTRVSNPY